MAAPATGASAVKRAPPSPETWRPAGPATKMRLSAGYEGGRRTVPPAKPTAGSRPQEPPPSLEWKSTAQLAVQPLDVPTP